ncbi:YgiT-type zinc finger protein [Litorilinea aerophila]|uniref:YgiT-type zinc finger protein n=1 Tax=Litorilinea aerophila TaxID=1204385 RepID=A0A540VG35_9CHLR|nr:YgiT-type zinc finger protein [Litorilinea aerophila]MCC9076735.1 YgiT-type zinc finger protein [Litorilinea aerophila]
MKPFHKCPVCGGELVEKEVEKLLRGGKHTAVIKVRAEVHSPRGPCAPHPI